MGLVAATKCDDGIRMVALMHHLYAICDDLSGSSRFPEMAQKRGGGRIPPSLVPGGKITPADGLDRHISPFLVVPSQCLIVKSC